MRKALQITMLIAVAAAGWFAWSWLFPSNEQKIKRVLSELADDVSFTGEQGNIANIAAVNSLLSHLHKDIEVVVEVPYEGPHTYSGRETIRDSAFAARKALSDGLKVRVYDPIIRINPNEDEASVDLTARIYFGGEDDFYVQELRFKLVNEDGDWLVRRVETMRTFGK